MKKIITMLCVIALSYGTYAQQMTPLDAGSKVRFTIKNFGVNVGGAFTGLKGSINYDAANVAAGSFNVTVDANTINTNNGSRDKHLKKEDYFDVEKHATLQFKSTKVSKLADGSLQMEGVLTIKGTSKAVVFPFKVTQLSVGALFQAEFVINRKDFKVGGNNAILGDKLTINLSVFAK
jgi:polyisoprenoid-binding protein YceI